MEPKFQSSFIPKGPVSTAGSTPSGKSTRRGGLYGYIAMIIFSISLILAIGVFGYRFYVKGTINRMSEEIATRENTLIPNLSREFIRLNDRIKATQEILNSHVVVSPLFEYLEASTLESVRLTELSYNTTPSGVFLVMRGEATGYTSVALQADIFNRGTQFKDTNFSELKLDDRGNVTFALETKLDQNLISYRKQVEDLFLSKPESAPQATTTSSQESGSSTTSTTSTSTATSTSSTTSN